MLSRLRTPWVAGAGALLLVVALSGAALGANGLIITGPTPEVVTDPLEPDTTTTWEDVDGNGIDDDCQDGEVVANGDAALAAFTEADTNGDGTISVDEAARTDWTGGRNCNHGGFVSFVAQQTGDEDEETEEETEEAAPEETEAEAEACEATVIEPFDPTTMTFGQYVSSVAQSDAVGGKNCNHGGAVSKAVHDAKVLAKEARDAAKAERAAEKAAAKAERAAQRAAAKAERDAAKAERGNGKGNGNGG